MLVFERVETEQRFELLFSNKNSSAFPKPSTQEQLTDLAIFVGSEPAMPCWVWKKVGNLKKLKKSIGAHRG